MKIYCHFAILLLKYSNCHTLYLQILKTASNINSLKKALNALENHVFKNMKENLKGNKS